MQRILACLCVLIGSAFSIAEAAKPNVLFIAVDDLRCELGCYGVDEIKSPRIDEFAESAVTFTRAYVQVSVCNPSRVAVMTGLRPDTTKVWDLPTRFRETTPDAVTIPQHFREHGYTAVSFGKIFHNPWPDNQSWDQPHEWPKETQLWSEEAKQQHKKYRQQMKADGKPPAKIQRMRAQALEALDIPDSQHIDGGIADQAISAMRELSQQDKPFFLAAGFVRPHLPFVVPKKYWDLYDRDTIPLADNQYLPEGAPEFAFGDRNQGGLYELRDYWDFADTPSLFEGSLTEDRQRALKHGYYASISMIDTHVGRLLDELKSLELEEETIVVLWSDHGWKLGEHNGWCKQTNHEIDTHTPLIIRVPGSKSAGQKCDALTEFVDIYPTLCDLAGLPLREELEGKSLKPVLKNPASEHKQAAISQYIHHYDGKHYMGYAMRTDRYRYIEWLNRETFELAEVELYDHETDPDENQNIADDVKPKLIDSLSNQLWSTIPKPKPEVPTTPTSAQLSPPNILFIAMDDLNDWIGCMGGHPQTITPNLDRLAKSSVLFTNAHCPAPACNPSRTSIMTGMSPHRSGLYDNGQQMREILPDAEIMPKTFMKHGYHASGSGKMLHYFIDADSWTEYYPEAKGENPFPRTLYPEKRPLSLPKGGPWQYVETDWGPLDATDDEYGGDFLVTKWVDEQLQIKRNVPFFLACGIYRPHEPWFVPKKYFEPFPLESIQLPPGYKSDDLDDLPPEGKKRGPNRYFAHIQKENQWKKGIQGYLASIHFADAMLGRVLDALEKSPHAKTTIVVLWSDHGWHLGEKQHWQKFTGWRRCTRVPLMIRVPKGTPSFPEGTTPSVCNQPVNLLSLFPTLLQLCGYEAVGHHDGPSLVPLLKNPNADWPHASYTFLGDRGSVAISTEDWRYIHYSGGDEELYNIVNDPYEWTNLANQPEHAPKLSELRKLVPETFAPKPEPSIKSLTSLKWHPAGDKDIPVSKPDGGTFPVHFLNQSERTVKLFWRDREGGQKYFADIPPGDRQSQQTRPGAVWLITDEKETPLGYFRVGDRKAKAVIKDE
ncbi:MAG: sulfatase-like hydrolase/transferase [Planctomycetaceae bacterium]|nr:sulfatase-like hydrolase/transferase [Planctomycetaceae bacterium]